MNLSQLSKWGNLCRCCPTPWYLDKMNASGVIVKDNRGEIVYEDDFGSIPDEWTSSMRDELTARSMALALWLVAMSETENDPVDWPA